MKLRIFMMFILMGVTSVLLSSSYALVYNQQIGKHCGIDVGVIEDIHSKILINGRQTSPERWIGLCDELRALGVSDPLKVIEKAPQLLSLDVSVASALSKFERIGVRDLRSILLERPELLFLTSLDEPLVVAAQTLQSLGFARPQDFLLRYPSLLLKTELERLPEQLRTLKDLGFHDPVALIDRHPRILTLSAKEIHQRYYKMRMAGFEFPEIAMAKWPQWFIGEPLSETGDVLALLQAEGFKSPLKMVEREPSLLNLDPALLLRPLISHLRSQWGLDVSEIEKRPKILKMRLPRLQKLSDLLSSLGISPESLSPSLRTYAIFRLSPERLRSRASTMKGNAFSTHEDSEQISQKARILIRGKDSVSCQKWLEQNTEPFPQ